MLILFQLLPERSLGQVIGVPYNEDSLQSSQTNLVSTNIKQYIKDFTLPKIQLPFDLKSKHPEYLPSKDSLKNWKRYLPEFGGQVSMGYDVGQLPNYFMPNTERPMQVFHTEAALNSTLLFLPVKLSWRYASVKNPIGVNNYFRLSMDTERFKQLPKLNQSAVSEQINQQLDELDKKQAELNGKLGYTELLRDKMKLQIQRILQEQEVKLKEIVKEQANSKMLEMDSLVRDSLSKVEPGKRDSLTKAYNEKYEQALQAKQKADSLLAEYEFRKKQIEQIKQQADTIQYYVAKLSTLKNKMDSLETNVIEQKDQWMKLAQGISAKQLQSLGLFKKLDIGLTYPKTSALSKNAIPIKGIDMEIQKGKWYYALTAGITMNNLMVTNNALQNSLQNTMNLFNQFDFQSIKDKRMLVMAKAGIGEKDKTHAFLGIRWTNKGISTGFYQTDSSSNVQPAAGIELDMRWVPSFTRGTAFDLVYGKTSLAQHADDSVHVSPLKSLFSNDRTHTGLLRITQQFNPIHSSVTASLRFLDAQADMASMGILQPNNMRFEVQTKHNITSGTQLGFTYRTDQNNVNHLQDTTKQVDMYGVNVSAVILEKIQISSQVNYLNQKYRQPQVLSQAMNYMAAFSANGSYKLFGFQQNAGLQADFYKITSVQGLTNLTHLSADQQTKFDVGKNTFTLAYFKSSVPMDSASAVTWLIQDAFQYKLKRIDLTAGLKMARSTKYGYQAGGFLGINFKWTKQLSWMARVEKLILGDFYNTYDPTRFARFPFYIQTSINYQFK